jgi:hypothetical protein
MRPNTTDPQPEQQFQAPTFSPDGKLFALVAFDFFEVQYPHGRVREPSAPRIVVWELDTMSVRATIPLPHFVLTDRIAISPDGTQVAAAYTSTPEKDKPLQFTLNSGISPRRASRPATDVFCARATSTRRASLTSPTLASPTSRSAPTASRCSGVGGAPTPCT